MEEEDLITKKDLLKLTGISYGQLYRWKRENLLPESWFVKKPSFTGQETFFPRERILKRIRGILELKDRYSLEEMAEMLSPELTMRPFDIGDLKNTGLFDPEVLELFENVLKKDTFSFIELLFISISCELKKSMGAGPEQLEVLILSMKEWLPEMKDASYRLIVSGKNADNYFLLLKQDSIVFFDKDTQKLAVFDLDEISRELNIKFNAKQGI